MGPAGGTGCNLSAGPPAMPTAGHSLQMDVWASFPAPPLAGVGMHDAGSGGEHSGAHTLLSCRQVDTFLSVRDTRDKAWAHIMLHLCVCAHMLCWALLRQPMRANRVCCLLYIYRGLAGFRMCDMCCG